MPTLSNEYKNGNNKQDIFYFICLKKQQKDSLSKKGNMDNPDNSRPNIPVFTWQRT